MTYIAFAEQVSNKQCGANGVTGLPSCETLVVNSHIYYFDPTEDNTAGDCGTEPAAVGCQNFMGKFKLLQTIITSGAQSIHFFETSITGQRSYYLAVAESRSSGSSSQPAQSSIWKFNGREFGLFQKLDTNYGEDFDSFVKDRQTFLIGASRGCPVYDDEPDAILCNTTTNKARTRIWYFDPFNDIFVLQPETLDTGTLHVFGANFEGAATADDAMIGTSGQPVSVTTFAMKKFDFVTNTETDLIQYVAIGNDAIKETLSVGICPNATRSICHAPWNMFSVSTVSTSVGENFF